MKRAITSALVVYCAACGSSSSSGGGASITEDRFSEAFANAICDNIRGCCENSGYPFNDAVCKQALAAYTPAGGGLPNHKYDPAAGAACIAAAREAARSCAASPAFSACDRVYVGAVPLGESCTTPGDCAAVSGKHVTCSFDSAPACVALSRVKSGDACSGTCVQTANGESCSFDTAATSGLCYEADGLFCNTSRTCQPLLQAGDSCDANGGCARGTFCSSSPAACAPLIALGSPCPDGEGCVDTAWCNASQLCVEKEPDGSPCSANTNECQSICGSSGLCGAFSLADAAVCGGTTPVP